MAFILCQHAVDVELLEGQIRRNLFEQSALLFAEIFGDELAALHRRAFGIGEHHIGNLRPVVVRLNAKPAHYAVQRTGED